MAYAYQATLYCDECGQQIIADLGSTDHGIDDIDRQDSQYWPQWVDDEAEADCPQHCDTCHVHLGNQLTADGRAYVCESILRQCYNGRGKWSVVREWSEFYGISVEELIDYASAVHEAERPADRPH